MVTDFIWFDKIGAIQETKKKQCTVFFPWLYSFPPYVTFTWTVTFIHFRHRYTTLQTTCWLVGSSFTQNLTDIARVYINNIGPPLLWQLTCSDERPALDLSQVALLVVFHWHPGAIKAEQFKLVCTQSSCPIFLISHFNVVWWERGGITKTELQNL